MHQSGWNNNLPIAYRNNGHVWDGQFRAQYTTYVTANLSDVYIDRTEQFYRQLEAMRRLYSHKAEIGLCTAIYPEPELEIPPSLIVRILQRIIHNG